MVCKFGGGESSQLVFRSMSVVPSGVVSVLGEWYGSSSPMDLGVLRASSSSGVLSGSAVCATCIVCVEVGYKGPTYFSMGGGVGHPGRCCIGGPFGPPSSHVFWWHQMLRLAICLGPCKSSSWVLKRTILVGCVGSFVKMDPILGRSGGDGRWDVCISLSWVLSEGWPWNHCPFAQWMSRARISGCCWHALYNACDEYGCFEGGVNGGSSSSEGSSSPEPPGLGGHEGGGLSSGRGVESREVIWVPFWNKTGRVGGPGLRLGVIAVWRSFVGGVCGLIVTVN